MSYIGNQIFKTIRYVNGLNPKTKSKFNGYYKNGKYLDYITRKYKFENKTLDIFNFDGKKLDHNDVNKLYEKFKNLKSEQFFWDSVFSFDKSLITNNKLQNGESIAIFFKPALEKFFKANFLDYEKMESFFVIHKDTKNLHIHFGYFEKEKTFISKNKKLIFKNNGNLFGKDNQKANQLKSDIDIALSEIINFSKTAELKKEINQNLYNPQLKYDKSFYKKICEHFLKLNKTKKSDYFFNKLDEYSKQMINEFLKDTIEKNPFLKNQYDFLKKSCSETEKEINKIYKKNNLNKKSNFYEDNINGKFGINTRLNNKILKEIKKSVDECRLQKSKYNFNKLHRWKKHEQLVNFNFQLSNIFKQLSFLLENKQKDINHFLHKFKKIKLDFENDIKEMILENG